jgi:hypothetical protein
MELCTKIQQFMNLEEIVRKETTKILRPIQAEVALQDKKFLLGSPVENTLSVEWLVMHPKARFVSLGHYYLVLSVQPAQKTGELNLVITSRQTNLSQEVFLEVYQESFLSHVQKTEFLTAEDFDRILGDKRQADFPKEFLEDDEEDEIEGFECCDNYEFKRFPFNGEINPAVVAKRIMTVARRIYRSQRIPDIPTLTN